MRIGLVSNAIGTGSLEDVIEEARIAAQDGFGLVCRLSRSAGLLGCSFCRGVMGPLESGRGGAPPLESASADTSGAHCRTLFGALLTDCAAPFRIARHL